MTRKLILIYAHFCVDRARTAHFKGEANSNNGYFSYDDRDELSPNILNLFGQFNLVINKIAKHAFNKNDYTELFKNSYRFMIESSLLGPIDSYEGVLTVFPNWKIEDGILAGRKHCIVAHEVGHEIARHPEKFDLPESLNYLNRFPTFSEFFPDWVTYKACGKDNLYRFGNLPALALRNLELTNFERPQYLFDFGEMEYTVYSWILEIYQQESETGKYVLEGFGLSKEDSQEAQQKVVQLKDSAKNMTNASKQMYGDDRDPHRMGVPLYLFIISVEEKLKRSVSQELVNSLWLLDKEPESYGHKVMISKKIEGKYQEVPFYVPTPYHFLQAFVSQFEKRELRKVKKLLLKQNFSPGLKQEYKEAIEQDRLENIAIFGSGK